MKLHNALSDTSANIHYITQKGCLPCLVLLSENYLKIVSFTPNAVNMLYCDKNDMMT